MDKNKLSEIYENIINLQDKNLSEHAFRSVDAKRLKKEENDELRNPFAVDRDRILYSGAYRRYQGKTQVFSFSNQFDEEMSNRSLHTTYVSQIARTIGTVLRLNVNLIEAIALGHDLGHTPFGHDGERALSRCCQKHGIGAFHHNIESLHIVDHISRKGNGLNLTFQVRDGIISHDGEVHNTKLYPEKNKTEKEIEDYIAAKTNGKGYGWMPATLEGCVVRISDTIAYIGQDIEDAIRMKILRREELPFDCVRYMGDKNSLIIDTLVKSVVAASYKNDYIAFDDETSSYLKKLKAFNYRKIYTAENVKNSNTKISKAMALLFEKYMNDITENNRESKIFKHFLDHKNRTYIEKFNAPVYVRDFIATMTDRYFNEEVKDCLLPGRF
ncbi:MAG: dGTP triphosphohydrolase [Candidatus Cloacimonadota bacterium]|nr:MAG: dGTP triphosphohydrolase [Candidatus Cloacimonadota bacterium]